MNTPRRLEEGRALSIRSPSLQSIQRGAIKGFRGLK